MAIRREAIAALSVCCHLCVSSPAMAQGAPATPGDVLLVPKARSDRGGLEQFRRTTGAIERQGSARIEVTGQPSASPGSLRETARRWRQLRPDAGSLPSGAEPEITLAPLQPVPGAAATASPPLTALPLSAVQQTTAAVRRALTQDASGSILTDLKAQAGGEATSAVIVPRGAITLAPTTGGNTTTGSGPAAETRLTPEEALGIGITEARKEGLRLRVNELVRLPSASSMNTIEQGNAAAAPIAQAYRDVVSTLGRVIGEPSSAANVEAFRRAGANYRAAYNQNWRALGTPEERARAARTFTALSRQSQLKAVYGVVTNFPPLSYRQIYHYSQRVVGIEVDGERVCSGIALNAEWIMTAGHCLARAPLSDAVAVSFNSGGSQVLRARGLRDRWPASIPGARVSDPLDYVFLRIEPGAPLREQISSLDAEAGSMGLRPLCLLTENLPYRRPVFAIGHPLGQDKTVHDYAYVWFPHRLSQSGFDQVESEAYAQAEDVARQIEDTGYANRAREALRRAYRPSNQNGEVSFTYMLPLDETADGPARPSFGIDTDTFSGDSGAPVFDRKTQCIAGVFGGGEDDQLVALQASWREHEFATPIAAILEHAREQPVDTSAAGQPVAAELVTKRRELLVILTQLSAM